MCDQQSLKSACAYAQSDQILCLSLAYSISVTLLTEQHLEFLSLKGGCTGLYESTLVKMPHWWKSHVMAHLYIKLHEKSYGADKIISCQTDNHKQVYSRIGGRTSDHGKNSLSIRSILFSEIHEITDMIFSKNSNGFSNAKKKCFGNLLNRCLSSQDCPPPPPLMRYLNDIHNIIRLWDIHSR